MEDEAAVFGSDVTRVIITGLFVAVSMTAGGGAGIMQKYIEDGNFGGKGSDHKSAVTEIQL